MRPLFLSLILASSFPFSAAHAEVRPPQPGQGSAFFESKIRPVLVEHCYQCHSEAEDSRKGGLLLDRESGWLDGGDSGQTVVPGDVEDSLLIHAVRYTDEDTAMPPKYQLDPEVVALLEKWIQLGAPGPAGDMGETEFSQLGDQDVIFDKAKTHWAFQPVTAVAPPAVNDPAWNENPIDRFVFAKMEEHQLTPSDLAPNPILARRLAYDLTGLPPTSEVATPIPQHVESLLASPHFGEHFARLWLDVARYADTANVNVPAAKIPAYYPFAFTYRDYVVESFNADKPYATFIKEQLAADLMDFEESAPELAALGFITVTPFLTDPHDFIDDVIDVTTRGLLGLTVSCSRCHDHKFEPIPTADYYSLHGVFSSIERPEPWDMKSHPVIKGYDITEADRADYLSQQTVIAEKIAAAKASGKKVGGLRPLDETLKKTDLAQLITFHDGAGARAMVVQELKKPVTSKIFLRGEPATRGEAAPRRFLKILDPEQSPFPEDNSGRLALAEKIVDPGNPLTARVFVNRIWGALIGSYLVDTPSDFGLQGSPPTHPELLDWLAADFIAHNGSLKHLVRTIVTSRTYRQSSQIRETMAAIDPTNVWLSRANAKRLSIEELRDSMLALSGQLDPQLKGHPKPLWGADATRRRSIYGLINRLNVDPTLRAFDFPSPTASAERRGETSVPQQALFALNSPFVIAQSAHLVTNLQLSEGLTAEQRSDAIFQRILRRDATPKEHKRLIPFFTLMEKRQADPWPLLAHSLLISNEFVYVD